MRKEKIIDISKRQDAHLLGWYSVWSNMRGTGLHRWSGILTTKFWVDHHLKALKENDILLKGHEVYWYFDITPNSYIKKGLPVIRDNTGHVRFSKFTVMKCLEDGLIEPSKKLLNRKKEIYARDPNHWSRIVNLK